MPELPEVETTLSGIKPHILHQTVENIVIRRPTLRWPIPAHLKKTIKDQVVKSLRRRGKYILIEFDVGTLILHLGMSGSLKVLPASTQPGKHDHVDIIFKHGKVLRFTDPRRFGALLWTRQNPALHPLLASIGPEPLTDKFSGDYLHDRSRSRKISVKTFLMDGKTVAGVGNIYATEALFRAGILPHKSAGTVTRSQYQLLAQAIKTVLTEAIEKGGTTLKDFVRSDGTPGYFSIELQVYGRAGKPCVQCQKKLSLRKLGQRATVFCTVCQK